MKYKVKDINRLVYPILLNYLLNSIFEILDQAIVGHYSSQSFALVGIASSMIYAVTGAFGIMSTVFNIIAAERKGKKDEAGFESVFAINKMLTLLIGFLFFIIGCLGGKLFFRQVYGITGNDLIEMLSYFYPAAFTVVQNMLIFQYSAYKRIFEAADGKFMLVKENGEKAVFTADGIQTAAFSAGSELYWNGWYKIDDSEGVSLFKANGECLGSRLKAAGVFANGCYFMSVRYAEDGAKAGIYGADGKRLLFTNDTAVKMLKNGWFIAEDGLYDNLGNSYIGTVNGHTLDWWFLFAVGMFMPQRR